MKKQGYVRRRLPGLGVAAVALLADAASKALALHAAAAGWLPLWFMHGAAGDFGLIFAWNRGMSFSMLDGVPYAPLLLGVVAVAASGWFIHWLGEKGGWCWHQAGLGLVIGGALGNLADRVVHGAVVDFILASPKGWFPYTFNVADACITVGVGLLLLDAFFNKKG